MTSNSSGWQSWRNEVYANSVNQWKILFQGQMREGVSGCYVTSTSLYNPVDARVAETHRPVETSWWDKHWNTIKHVGYAVASTVIGIAASFVTTPVGGLAIGLAVYAAMTAGDRYVSGQTVGQSLRGGFGDATGVGGVYTGFTGQDFGTGEDLHLTPGQQAFAGVMGVVQLATLGMGVRGASAVNAAARDAALVAASRASLGRVAASVGSKVGTGMAIGGGMGAIQGGIGGYLSGGWDSVWEGALEGGLSGTAVGAAMGLAGWFENPTCFAAGTEVVVGAEYEEEDGTLRQVTATRLSQIGKVKRLAVMEKARRRFVRYLMVPIECLQAGDWVLTRDEHDAEGELFLTQIAEKFERTAYHLRHLMLQSSSGQTQIIPTTNEHPAYVPELGLWIRAADVEVGQSLNELPGNQSLVTGIRHEQHPGGIKVYNFRVAGTHTYFVRAEGSDAEPVWVHNSCNVYKVGKADEVREFSEAMRFEANHAPMSAQAETLIADWNAANRAGGEAAILLPYMEHQAVTAAQAARTVIPASARELLAQELWILRANTNAPSSALLELSELAQKLHPTDYLKL